MRALIVVAVLALAVPSADAQCALPRSAVFPSGGALPPRPTLYRFEPAFGAPAPITVEGRDGPVPFTTRDVSASPDVRVTAIELDATAGPIQLHAGDATYIYAIERAPAPPPPTVSRIAEVHDAWSCSYTDGLKQLAAPGVAAFRARWSDGVAIVSPDYRAFWSPDADPDWARVFLGHVSCTGLQIPSRLVGRLDFTLEAIYPDGSTREVELPRAAAAPPPPIDPPAILAPTPASRADPTRAWIVALSGTWLAFLIALARRRRRALAIG